MEGADEGDADGGTRYGQNQRGERVHSGPPRRLGASHYPGHGHSDDEADKYRDARVEEGIHNELGRLEAYLPEVVEGVLEGERGKRPALANRSEHHANLWDQ